MAYLLGAKKKKKQKRLRAYLVTVSADFAFDLNTAQTVSCTLLKTVTVKVSSVPESIMTPCIQRRVAAQLSSSHPLAVFKPLLEKNLGQVCTCTVGAQEHVVYIAGVPYASEKKKPHRSTPMLSCRTGLIISLRKGLAKNMGDRSISGRF